MAYNITLSNGTSLIAGGLADNTADSTSSSLVLLGKNYKSYGLFLNQNFVRLMENFAKSTAPTAPLPGQIWYNSTSKILNVNTATNPALTPAWKTLAVMTFSAGAPADPLNGEQWYDSTDGQFKIFTDSGWRTIGPLSKIATGNTGAIPDTIADSPPTTTYVILKFFVDNVLVAIWSKDGPFDTSQSGFLTIRKGLNLHSSLGHTFWGNSEVASNLYVNNVKLAGNTFVRNDVSASINGALTLTNDGGLTFGAASDFVGSVSTGVVTLRNKTNNKNLIFAVNVNGVQTTFLQGNAISGLAEAANHVTGTSSSYSLVTKNYVDILSGSVNGIANFFGHVTPNVNGTLTLGNTSNRWNNIYTENISVGNVNATNTFTTNSNVAQIYLGADIVPTANNSSNIGSGGRFLNTVHAQNSKLSGTLTVGGTVTAGYLTSTGSGQIANNFSVGGNFSLTNNTPSTSTISGALTVDGGVGVVGNVNVGGIIQTPTLPSGTSNTAVATTAFVQTLALPSGSVMMWSTASAPSGWLLCNGSAVSRTAYAVLFAVIGTTFGVGDGATTFNLPDYNNRTPVGAGGLYALGANGGSKDAVVVSHSHTLSGGSVTGTFVTGFNTTSAVFDANVEYAGFNAITNFTSTSGTPTYSSPTVQTNGSSGTDQNMQPYLAINFIIKT